MSPRARASADRVIVDTSGFIAGGFAAAVKQRKIREVDPDAVVLIQTGDEAEHLVRNLVDRARPVVLRLPAIRGTRHRTAVDRRRHRDLALARHLEGAAPVVLRASRVGLRGVTGETVPLERVGVGALAAMHARDGTTLALGVIEAVDLDAGTLTVRTTRGAPEIAAIIVGETMAA